MSSMDRKRLKKLRHHGETGSQEREAYLDPKIEFPSFYVCGTSKPPPITPDHFHKNAKTLLRELNVSPSPVQQHVWACMERKRSLLCVAGSEVGKTLGYVVDIMHQALTRAEKTNENLKQTNRPETLIVVPTHQQVVDVVNLCKRIISIRNSRHTERVFVIGLYACGSEQEACIDLLNGCSVLVTTPGAFLRTIHAAHVCGGAVKHRQRLVQLDGLRHVVFDQLDLLLEHFRWECNQILFDEVMEAFRACASKPTFSLFASHWTKGIASFYRGLVLLEPVLILHPFLSVCLFANISPKPTVCLATELPMVLRKELTLLADQILRRRTVIFCTDEVAVAAAAAVVREAFPDIDPNTQLLVAKRKISYVHEGSVKSEMAKLQERWKFPEPGIGPVLVLPDTLLQEFQLQDAQILIHYDIPKGDINKASAFGYRFSFIAAFIDHLHINHPSKDVLLKKDASTTDAQDFSYKNGMQLQSRPPPRSTTVVQKPRRPLVNLFITNENGHQAKDLEDFLNDVGCAVPSELTMMARGVRNVDNSLSKSLCPYLKCLGRCTFNRRCSKQYRHVVQPRSDRHADRVPTTGDVFVKITSVQSANCLYGQIWKHVSLAEDDTETGELFINDRLGELAQALEKELEQHMMLVKSESSEQPRKIDPSEAKPGCFGIVAHKRTKKFVRVELVTIDAVRMMATVVLVDEGPKRWRINLSEVYLLPEHLWPSESGSFPPLAVEIIIANLRPIDNDVDFTENTRQFVCEKIVGCFLRGRIRLALSRTLWLSPAVLTENVASLNLWNNRLNLGEELITKQLALANPNHLAKLYDLIRKTSASCWQKLQLPVSYEAGDHLDEVLRQKNKAKNDALTNSYCYRKNDVGLPNVEYALLDADKITPVYVCSVESPGAFFVQKRSSYDLLRTLEKDILKTTNGLVRLPVEDMESGSFCIAKQSGKWQRCMIESIQQQVSGENFEEHWTVTVLFVDYGDTEDFSFTGQFCDGIAQIEFELLGRLPCQAIYCAFPNLRSPRIDNSEWIAEQDSDELWDLTHTNDGRPILLHAQVYPELSLGLTEEEYTDEVQYGVSLITDNCERVEQLLVQHSAAINVAHVFSISRLSERLRSWNVASVDSQLVQSVISDPSSLQVLLETVYGESDIGKYADVATALRVITGLFTSADAIICGEIRSFFLCKSDLPALINTAIQEPFSEGSLDLAFQFIQLLLSFVKVNVPGMRPIRFSRPLMLSVLYICSACNSFEDESLAEQCCVLVTECVTKNTVCSDDSSKAVDVWGCVFSLYALTDIAFYWESNPVVFHAAAQSLCCLAQNYLEDFKALLCKEKHRLPVYLMEMFRRVPYRVVEAEKSILNLILICLRLHSVKLLADNELAFINLTLKVSFSIGCSGWIKSLFARKKQCFHSPLSETLLWTLKVTGCSAKELRPHEMHTSVSESLYRFVLKECGQLNEHHAEDTAEALLSSECTVNELFWRKVPGDSSSDQAKPTIKSCKFGPRLVKTSRNICPQERRPTILWSQTEGMIRIAVQLQDVVWIELSATERTLNFFTEVNNAEYAFTLRLHKRVCPEESIHNIAASEVLIDLKKRKIEEWKQLTSTKLSFVHVDFAKLSLDETDGSQKTCVDKQDPLIAQDELTTQSTDSDVLQSDSASSSDNEIIS